MRDARAKPNAAFQVDVQKWPVFETGGASFAKKPHLDTKADWSQGGWQMAGDASPSSTEGELWRMAFLIV